MHHVFARGNGRAAIYLDRTDHHIYLRLLRSVTEARSWSCLAYCLMPNHVHLLIETRRGDLGAGMQWLHGRYAQTFNGRHRRGGHVFQGRYGAVRLESSAQLCIAAGYIARNPLEAGLCRKPEEWPWSSYRLVMTAPGGTWLDDGRLLEHFSEDEAVARKHYAKVAVGGVENLKGV